jgi:hypothetical protein
MSPQLHVLGFVLKCYPRVCVLRMFASMNYESHSFTRQSNHFDVAYKQVSTCVVPQILWTVDLVKLQNEHDILENGLATCVTYLIALRKKLARTEWSLNLDPPPSRKRRKKMEQSKRILESEIKNRLRDEQAFLSNLQACETNIYVTRGVRNQFVDLSSTKGDCTSSTTQFSCNESAPTEVSWNGWTENTMTSPFEKKKRSKPAFVNDVAPDEVGVGQDQGDRIIPAMMRPLPDRNSEQNPALSVPWTSTRCHSFLSPEASVFEPSNDSGGRDERPKNILLAARRDADNLYMRRTTRARINRSLQDLSIHCKEEQTQTWCNTTPQRSPREQHASNGAGGRHRSNSL